MKMPQKATMSYNVRLYLNEKTGKMTMGHVTVCKRTKSKDFDGWFWRPANRRNLTRALNNSKSKIELE